MDAAGRTPSNVVSNGSACGVFPLSVTEGRSGAAPKLAAGACAAILGAEAAAGRTAANFVSNGAACTDFTLSATEGRTGAAPKLAAGACAATLGGGADAAVGRTVAKFVSKGAACADVTLSATEGRTGAAPKLAAGACAATLGAGAAAAAGRTLSAAMGRSAPGAAFVSSPALPSLPSLPAIPSLPATPLAPVGSLRRINSALNPGDATDSVFTGVAPTTSGVPGELSFACETSAGVSFGVPAKREFPNACGAPTCVPGGVLITTGWIIGRAPKNGGPSPTEMDIAGAPVVLMVAPSSR
jgi:hypothetical protein